MRRGGGRRGRRAGCRLHPEAGVRAPPSYQGFGGWLKAGSPLPDTALHRNMGLHLSFAFPACGTCSDPGGGFMALLHLQHRVRPPPKREKRRPDGFTGELDLTLKEESTTTLLKLFPRKKEHFQIHPMRTIYYLVIKAG